jgi:hypothetical protein
MRVQLLGGHFQREEADHGAIDGFGGAVDDLLAIGSAALKPILVASALFPMPGGRPG